MNGQTTVAGKTAEAKRQDGFIKIFLIGLLCLFTLSAHALGYADRELDPDEVSTMQVIANSFAEMSRDSAALYPPLYFYLLKLWVSIVGLSLVTLRLFSLFFALWAIYLAYRLGAELYTEREGWWAALLMTVSNFHLYYATEIRMYSMVVALSLLSTLWFFRSFVQQGQKGNKAIYTVITLLLAWTHYFTWFLIGSQGIYLLLRAAKDQRDSLSAWVKAILILVPLQLPWVILLAEHWAFSYATFVSDVEGLQSHGAHGPSGAVYLIGAFNGMLPIQDSMRYSFAPWGLPFLVFLWQRRVSLSHSISTQGIALIQVPAGYLLLSMLMPTVGLAIVSLGITPLFIPRYLIYCMPMYYLLVSRCAVLVSPDWRKQLLILLPALIWSAASAVSLRLFF